MFGKSVFITILFSIHFDIAFGNRGILPPFHILEAVQKLWVDFGIHDIYFYHREIYIQSVHQRLIWRSTQYWCNLFACLVMMAACLVCAQ